ncbi:MAG TPA: hypothetical protein VGQ83_26525 [Polyangia bacterium]|jgi:hypothetical protein
MTRIGALSLLLSGALLAPGCEGQDGSAGPAVAAEGSVTVQVADEAAGRLVMSYALEGRTLTFESILGPKRPADTMLPGETRDREVDVRVLDQEGNPVFTMFGGHGPIEPSWVPDQSLRVHHGVTVERRQADVRLASQAQSVLLAVTVPTALEQLRQAAAGAAAFVPTALDPGDKGVTEADEAKVAPRLYQSGASQWDYAIYRGDAFFDGSPADHTAMLVRAWNSSYSILASWGYGNHGRLPWESGMSYQCCMSGFTNTGATSPTVQMCGGAFLVTHVCNNDTWLERDNIKYNTTYSTYGGHCFLGPNLYWSPGCN